MDDRLLARVSLNGPRDLGWLFLDYCRSGCHHPESIPRGARVLGVGERGGADERCCELMICHTHCIYPLLNEVRDCVYYATFSVVITLPVRYCGAIVAALNQGAYRQIRNVAIF